MRQFSNKKNNLTCDKQQSVGDPLDVMLALNHDFLKLLVETSQNF